MSVFEDIREILVDQLGVTPDSIAEDTPLEELKMDSLDLVEFVCALEEQYDIELPDEVVAAGEVETVADVVQRIQDMIA